MLLKETVFQVNPTQTEFWEGRFWCHFPMLYRFSLALRTLSKPGQDGIATIPCSTLTVSLFQTNTGNPLTQNCTKRVIVLLY